MKSMVKQYRYKNIIVFPLIQDCDVLHHNKHKLVYIFLQIMYIDN